MRAFVQKVNGEFDNINFLTAYKGFVSLGYEVETFHFSILETVLDNITRSDVVMAGIPVLEKILCHLRITPPYFPTYPEPLRRFLHRSVSQKTIKEVREYQQTGQTQFIKPLDKCRKLFNGHVVKSYRDLIATAHLPEHTIVWTSEAVNFTSEYRVFINHTDILGAKHYKGNFRQIIDFDVVEDAVKTLVDAPVSYCLDFGLVEGETVLVEANDANSMGCYGLDSQIYAKMIIDRWEEMMEGAI